MTAQILVSELTTLISESKKKAPDVRNAAEKALQELKSLTVTSEAQTAADVKRRPYVVRPFVAACKTKNTKLVLPSINALQRLAASGALTKDTLPDVLEAFQDSTSQGLDVQLKILQSIPTLLQHYSSLIHGTLQASVLQICSTLQQTKTAAISRTASATLQQAVSFLFEKLESDREKSADDANGVALKLGEKTLAVGSTAADAYRTLQDICLLIEGEKPLFIHKANLSATFGLEVLESVLTDHSHIFAMREEQQYLLKNRVMPLITRVLSERLSFSITVRITRILCIMLREHLDIVKEECEIPLSLLNHSLDSDAGTPWRRALCMEAMRLLFSNSTLVLELFTLFDEKDDRRSIIQESLASFVRLASEKPNVIGVGRHSSYPAAPNTSKLSQDQAAAAAATDAGIISGDIGVSEVNVPGISTQWSVMRTPCLDLLDKSDAPAIPETYVYSMVLTCVNNLTDTLAKIILPLTVPEKTTTGRIKNDVDQEAVSGASRQRSNSSATKYRTKPIPLNPIDLADHPAHDSIKATVSLVSKCWPAILATSSTFLYAALDADYYRGLIRSFQKITQIAGLLRLSTPRDAFLTTLAKAAVPSSPGKSDNTASTPTSSFGGSPRMGTNSGRFQSTDNYFANPESPTLSRRNSVETGGPLLSQRNLICLRALVNLAIALGPVLHQAWSIVLDAIQRASVLLANSGTVALARDYKSGSLDQNGNVAAPQTSLGGEISAVESAVTRLIQSTGEYPNDSFKDLLSAICNLVTVLPLAETSLEVPSTPTHGPRRPSGLNTQFTLAPQYDHFAIAKIGEVARINLMRLTYDTNQGGWSQLLDKLLAIALAPSQDVTARLMAADVIGSLTVESAAVTTIDSESVRAVAQERSLRGLQTLIQSSRSGELREDMIVDNTAIDIHKTALDALGAILERCGEALTTGWDTIFAIISSTFQSTTSNTEAKTVDVAELVSGRLAKSAFGSLQLVSSDFLRAVPRSCFPVLIDIASRFCAQKVDLNLSLTAITICWNINDYVQTLALRKKDEPNPKQLLDMWMDTQRRLLPITTDERADVRNGVVHTLFRILDSAGDHLQPETWSDCFQDIIFGLMEQNVRVHRELSGKAEEIQQAQTKPWTATSKIIIFSVGNLCSSFLEVIASTPNFTTIWQEMLNRFLAFIELNSFEISTDVFLALSNIVESSEEQHLLDAAAIDRLNSLWMNVVPVNGMRGEALEGEKAMAAYVALQKQLLKLLQPRLEARHMEGITSNLNKCLEAAVPAPYTSDVDSTTALQREALESMRLLKVDVQGGSSIIIRALSRFANLPYTKAATVQTSTQLTFVAFAKEAMQQLQDMIVETLSTSNEISTEALEDGLKAFNESIQRKYKWTRQGKEPSLWRKATTCSVKAIQSIAKSPALQAIETANPQFWELVAPIVSGIMHADLSHTIANEQLLKDESFDLGAAEELLTLITPFLASTSVTQNAQLGHVRALFQTSILHPAGSDGNPNADPLAKFKTIRLGRTVDPPFNPRVRMCYFAFDQLLALVAAPTLTETPASNTSNQISIAAFPYLVLRAALPLKTYIADQPLRGLMPLPTSQRLELRYVLSCMAELQTSPAVSAPPTALSKPNSHLSLLAPLATQALQYAARDAELGACLRTLVAAALV